MLRELDSYDDGNYQLKINTKEYVLKIHNGVESLEFIQCQMKTLNKLCGGKIKVPKDVVQGDFVEILKHRSHFVRLLEYIPGVLLYDQVKSCENEFSVQELMEGFGKFLGSVEVVLVGFTCKAAKRHLVWDLKAFNSVKGFAQYVVDPKKAIIQGVFQEYNGDAEIRLGFRESIVQNDANDRNVVVNENGEFGLLDFGDVIQTWTVNQLAIALAYCVVGYFTDADDVQDAVWMSRCARIFKGYHSVFPLELKEIEQLYILAKARLATSALIGAFSIYKDPTNQYLLVHAKPAWLSLEGMNRVGKSKFSSELRAMGSGE